MPTPYGKSVGHNSPHTRGFHDSPSCQSIFGACFAVSTIAERKLRLGRVGPTCKLVKAWNISFFRPRHLDLSRLSGPTPTPASRQATDPAFLKWQQATSGAEKQLAMKEYEKYEGKWHGFALVMCASTNMAAEKNDQALGEAHAYAERDHIEVEQKEDHFAVWPDSESNGDSRTWGRSTQYYQHHGSSLLHLVSGVSVSVAATRKVESRLDKST
ncbi:hypothetical protein DFH08DRAFT_812555 [Mycena albidolilacea]|uniref:Uncharacterized protein n=1 Tax=Mycena albidolilacea TaxID=1033008 RepID=A0AAD6ZV01_9AGAR|nr:hypothetical protein DFH08DRAFT_812555 [Mycena albidolilacea]